MEESAQQLVDKSNVNSYLSSESSSSCHVEFVAVKFVVSSGFSKLPFVSKLKVRDRSS